MRFDNLPDGVQPRFPDGKRKALVMSYDDGSEHDRHLLEIFNRHGIRGSFHLNSGKLGRTHYIAPEEVQHLYRGHEVSCHTVSHPDLTQLPEDQIRREILDDRHALEDLTGHGVRGLAYPFGKYDERVIALLPELGIEYARTVAIRDDFGIAPDFLTWGTSCHHNLAAVVGKDFLERTDDGEGLQVFHVWGHSYELDGFMTADFSKDWRYMETFCDCIQGREEIYYATTIQLVDYLKALQRLTRSPDGSALVNQAPITLWITRKTAVVALAPGEQLAVSSAGR
jgi:hypothetical protein